MFFIVIGGRTSILLVHFNSWSVAFCPLVVEIFDCFPVAISMVSSANVVTVILGSSGISQVYNSYNIGPSTLP